MSSPEATVGLKSVAMLTRATVGGSLGSLFIIYFYWAPYIVMTTLVIANTGRVHQEDNRVWCLVHGIPGRQHHVSRRKLASKTLRQYRGPQTFLAKQAPTYTGGVVAMLVCYCVAICVCRRTAVMGHANRFSAHFLLLPSSPTPECKKGGMARGEPDCVV